jgi:hypothetical protein
MLSDGFICSISSFRDWQEMLAEAGNDWAAGRSGIWLNLANSLEISHGIEPDARSHFLR